ncbi:MAG: hypothetical protein HXX16_17780 [Bacteroidales bacterium]|nr:hypothetical protein [Bacteroidales bacterium]
MKIRFTFLFCVFLFSCLFVFPQEYEKNLKIDISSDIVSRYVWRGTNLSESPAFQPNLALSYRGLLFGSWGSYSFARENLQEVDLFLTYTIKNLSFTINDYFNPFDTLGVTGDYFHLKNKTTRHIIEGLVTLNCSKSFPLSLIAGVMLYGNDKGFNGKNRYSTYFELKYTSIVHNIEITPFLGLTPNKGYYGKNFNIVNIGVKAVKSVEITDKFKLPLTANFIVNPEKEMVYLVFGMSF